MKNNNLRNKYTFSKESIDILMKPINYNSVDPEFNSVMVFQFFPEKELNLPKSKPSLLLTHVGLINGDLILKTKGYPTNKDTSYILIATRSKRYEIDVENIEWEQIDPDHQKVVSLEVEVKRTLREQLNLAYQIALDAHNGQYDKQGKPYFNHVLKVSNRCKSMKGKICGMLHDTVEDCEDITLQVLIDKGIDEELVNVVKLLTKWPNQPYNDYKEGVKSNKLAIEVKLSDLKHNMDLTRNKVGLTEKEINRTVKYHKLYVELYQALDEYEVL